MSVDKTLRQAAKLAAKGDRAGAARLYREVLAKFPANVQARQGLAALAGPGAPGPGPRPGPRPAPAAGMSPPPQQLAALTQMLQRGDVARVVAEGQRLALLFPRAPALLNLVAMALSKLGRLEDSLAWSDRVIAADPTFAGAHVNKAAALARLGRFAEVEQEARAALAIDPRQPQALITLGYALVNTRRAKDAEAPFREAVRLAPRELLAHIGLGNAMAVLGHHKDALACFETALEIAPDSADALNNLGNSLAALGRSSEAADRLAVAVQSHPNNAVMITNYARAQRELGQIHDAIALCERAISITETNVDSWLLLGSCRHELGDKASAVAALDRVATLDPENVQALAMRWHIGKFTIDHPDFPRLKAASERTDLSPVDRNQVEMELFGALDRAGETDDAFAHLARAKQIRSEVDNYNLDNERKAFAALKDMFSEPVEPLGPEDVAEIASPYRPLFIVGMPRSGTTLVEQILVSHSQVHGGGELGALGNSLKALGWGAGKIGEPPTRDVLRQLRRGYFKASAPLAGAEPVLTDKTPLNFRFLGFVLAAMPEARVLVMRRDARATCWSNFSNNFIGKANSFGNTMLDTAEMYRMHLDIVAFWKQLYPDRITIVPYERLTEHQEEESRKLVAAAGLDWEPACLDFHKTERAVRTASAMQVRKKMYTGSSEAWRRYEAHIGPMLEALEGLD